LFEKFNIEATMKIFLNNEDLYDIVFEELFFLSMKDCSKIEYFFHCLKLFDLSISSVKRVKKKKIFMSLKCASEVAKLRE